MGAVWAGRAQPNAAGAVPVGAVAVQGWGAARGTACGAESSTWGSHKKGLIDRSARVASPGLRFSAGSACAGPLRRPVLVTHQEVLHLPGPSHGPPLAGYGRLPHKQLHKLVERSAVLDNLHQNIGEDQPSLQCHLSCPVGDAYILWHHDLQRMKQKEIRR